MSWGSAIRSIKIPTLGEVLGLPGRIKKESQNIKLNEIHIRYWDRHFKHPKTFIGKIDHTTSLPIIYFSSPKPSAIIQFDDCTYEDQDKRLWIEVVEDYAYGIDRNSELAQFLGVRYYNDFAGGKVESRDDEKFKVYSIPLLLNRIPREVVRLNSGETYNARDKAYVQNKIEVTQDVIQQLGTAEFLRGRGKKKDGGAFFIGALMGGALGIVIGIFVAFAFLVHR